jgi:hypothetical protein
MTLDAGWPDIDGARLPGSTVMLNGPIESLKIPSVTLMLIPVKVPACASVGVPANLPVAESKLAQFGTFAALNRNVCPSPSKTPGVKAYCCPPTALPGGVPLSTGGWFT